MSKWWAWFNVSPRPCSDCVNQTLIVLNTRTWPCLVIVRMPMDIPNHLVLATNLALSKSILKRGQDIQLCLHSQEEQYTLVWSDCICTYRASYSLLGRSCRQIKPLTKPLIHKLESDPSLDCNEDCGVEARIHLQAQIFGINLCSYQLTRPGVDKGRWDAAKSGVESRLSSCLQTHLQLRMVRTGSVERILITISDGRRSKIKFQFSSRPFAIFAGRFKFAECKKRWKSDVTLQDSDFEMAFARLKLSIVIIRSSSRIEQNLQNPILVVSFIFNNNDWNLKKNVKNHKLKERRGLLLWVIIE